MDRVRLCHQLPSQTRFTWRALQYGECEDPCKMTHSGMALIRRGPSAKPANSNLHAGHIMQAADQYTRSDMYAADSSSTSGSTSAPPTQCSGMRSPEAPIKLQPTGISTNQPSYRMATELPNGNGRVAEPPRRSHRTSPHRCLIQGRSSDGSGLSRRPPAT